MDATLQGLLVPSSREAQISLGRFLLLRFSRVVFGTHVGFCVFIFFRKIVKKYITVFSCEMLLSSTEQNVFLSLGCACNPSLSGGCNVSVEMGAKEQ